MKKIKEKIESLREKIREHNKRYFVEDNPIISDEEYDRLMQKLIKLEEKYPQFQSKNSPSKKVGGKVLDEFEKHNHKEKMLSLNKGYNKEDLIKFNKRVKDEVIESQYIIQPKVDGLALKLIYKNGKLVKAVTRGNGEVGEDVTENVKTINNVPLKLSLDFSGTIIGEVYISKKDFKKYNQDKEYANARNLASGSLRQLDTKITAKRPLKFISFADNFFERNSIKNTFLTTPILLQTSNIQEVIGYCQNFTGDKREDFEYEIDGLVIKVKDKDKFKQMGETSKFPRGAIAYKFPAQRKESTIKDIKLQVGRTGKITPVAILKTVRLAGTKVSKATLHNQDYINDKDIRIGDKVLVEKAGDIIPKVVKVLKNKRNEKVEDKTYQIPNKCPKCNSELIKTEKDADIKCENLSCPAQLKRQFEHFVSRDALNIKGLGNVLVEKILDNNLIEDIAEIFHINKNALKELERVGEKTAENLMQAIKTSKEKSNLAKVLYGLGIPLVGKSTARKIAKEYGDIDKLIRDLKNNNYYAKISHIDGLGGEVLNNLVHFFLKEYGDYKTTEKNLEIIKKLKKANVDLSFEQNNNTSNKLKNLTIVVTGSFENYTRKDLDKIITENGGKRTSSVSGNTDYLLVGKNAGSKVEKAKNKGVPTISIKEFEEMF